MTNDSRLAENRLGDHRFGRRNAAQRNAGAQTVARQASRAADAPVVAAPGDVEEPEETSKATVALYAGAGIALLFSTVLFALVGLPMLSNSLAKSMPAQLTPVDVANQSPRR